MLAYVFLFVLCFLISFLSVQWESNEMCVTLTFLFLDSLTPEIEADRSGGRTDAERTIQGGNLQKAINLDLAL